MTQEFSSEEKLILTFSLGGYIRRWQSHADEYKAFGQIEAYNACIGMAKKAQNILDKIAKT